LAPAWIACVRFFFFDSYLCPAVFGAANGAADNPPPVLGSVLVPYKVLVVGCNSPEWLAILLPARTGRRRLLAAWVMRTVYQNLHQGRGFSSR